MPHFQGQSFLSSSELVSSLATDRPLRLVTVCICQAPKTPSPHTVILPATAMAERPGEESQRFFRREKSSSAQDSSGDTWGSAYGGHPSCRPLPCQVGEHTHSPVFYPQPAPRKREKENEELSLTGDVHKESSVWTPHTWVPTGTEDSKAVPNPWVLAQKRSENEKVRPPAASAKGMCRLGGQALLAPSHCHQPRAWAGPSRGDTLQPRIPGSFFGSRFFCTI